jgi:diacylglycerol O-acyltransferase / wax synthase
VTARSLSAEDVALLCAEPRGAQLQIGALCFFQAAPLRDECGRLRLAELRSHIDSRLDDLPRFRQRIAPVLADLAAPVWVDDTGFDVARHTPRVELPAPGGAVALREFMDRLLSEPMDLAHPLWDIHLIEGVDDEVVAIVVRAHHVMADGLALHAAATLLLDPAPQPPRRQTHHWSPEQVPGPLHLSVTALADRTHRQVGIAVDTMRNVFDPRRFASNTRLAGHVLGAIRNSPPLPAPTVAFTGPVGRRRAFAWDTIPMADVIEVKQACGATVNDVVLAIAAGALRRQLQAIGSFDPTKPEPRALIPIGGHEPAAPTLGNRFSITTVGLPVGIDDPLERVTLIHSRTHRHAASPTRSLLPHLFSITDLIPIPVLRALVPRVLARQPLVNLAVSNVPGSRNPLYLWESRLLGLHPFITGVGNIALIIGVLSYVDSLGIGITVDPDVAGDPQAIVGHVRAAATELATLVR